MKDKKHLLNGDIKAHQVKLIQENDQMVTDLQSALDIADDQQLDLVQVGEQGNIAVCKIMDYGKFLYEAQKKQRANKKERRDTKEVYFRPNTDTADVQNKVKRIKGFLQKGHEVQVGVKFKGRELSHKEIGINLLKGIAEQITSENHGKIKSNMSDKGRSLSVSFAP